MNAHSLELLDFTHFARDLAGAALSEDFTSRILQDPACLFVKDQAQAEEIYFCVDVLRQLHTLGKLPAFQTVPSLARVLEKLSGLGESLEPEDFAALLGLFEFDTGYTRFPQIVAVRGGPDDDKLSRVLAWCGVAGESAKLAAEFRKMLRPDGTLDEEAIPSLRALRSEMQKGNQVLAGLARATISDAGQDNFAADQPVFRDGRVMLPVKSDSRSRVSGFVQGLSDSGQTLYLETPELQSRNNQQVQLQAQYQIELRRLYRELSTKAREHSALIGELAERLERYDVLHTRLGWQRRCTGIIPIFSDRVSLLEARHLLIGRSVVPVSISYSTGIRVLIVTGPNAGGKTIGLKLLGLCAVFARAAMTLPCAEGSSIPWFDAVYVDIGDEQSVLQAKSTFSAHMANIGSIAENCGPNSLVLLDELGTGTDPGEGAALGLAVLEHLVKAGSRVYVTSHHAVLKAWATTESCAENASMLFDESNGKPAFKFVYGIPGLSHAVDAAASSGVPQHIIARARIILEEGGSNYDMLFRTLQEKIEELELVRAEYEEHKRRLESSSEDLSRRAAKLDARQEEIEQKLSADAKHTLAQLHRKIEAAVQDFLELAQTKLEAAAPEAAELRGQVLAEASKLRGQLSAESAPLENSIAQNEERRSKRREKLGRSLDLKPGARVKIKNSTEILTLLSARKDGSWRASTRSLKLTIQPDSIVTVLDSQNSPDIEYQQEKAPKDRRADISYVPGKMEFVLDIRGKRVEEALLLVEAQLQAALVQGSAVFGVIHGKGTGALQAAVHEFLGTKSGVQSVEFARPEDGGTGKSWVFLQS